MRQETNYLESFAQRCLSRTRTAMDYLPDSFRESLKSTHQAGLAIVSGDRNTCHFPPEPFDTVSIVEEHRWFWRPKRIRLLLVAESHVYTPADEAALLLGNDRITTFLRKRADTPLPRYVRLVYCLGYGETMLVRNPAIGFSNPGTKQYWDLFGKITGRGPCPAGPFAARLSWKLDTLRGLWRMGIWLLDASVHAIYLGNRIRRSRDVCQALHRQWWEGYGGKLVNDCGRPPIWVIGATTYTHLHQLPEFTCRGFIYQPNARNVDLNTNWDRLMDDVAGLT